ncbi:MAG: hypothetical protein RL149_735 [Actinomycetota bacterium]
MARVLADNHDATVATNNFALVANLLDAWVYLHVSCFFFGVIANRLFVAINNSATSQVVCAELYDYAILWEDSNVVLAHLS